MTAVVDWDLAVATGLRLVRPGPQTTAQEADRVVRQLRRAADRAVMPVREVTGLDAPVEHHRAVVVGRPEWIRANVEQLRLALAPLTDVMAERRPSAAVTAVGSRATAVQVGSVLAWLATKVLGQYEAFSAPGRLLLVAPTIVHAERAMDVDPVDFRLWVCLHEETHRVQFGAVPWLGPHFEAEVHAYLSATETDAATVLARVVSSLRSPREAGLIDLVQSPEQREILERLTALMSLLEGHADVVMDEVGPQVVPSVAQIRRRFTRRREQAGTLDGVLRRVLGLDAKLRQYADGARFVRGVVERVGMSGFNAVWSGPESLPHPEEIADPARWVRRVHG